MFLKDSMKHCQLEWRVKTFLLKFSVKKRWKLWAFPKQFRHSPLPTAFLSLTLIFHKRIFRVCSFFVYMKWQGGGWLGTKFLVDESFSPASFWRNQLEIHCFSREQVLLCRNSAALNQMYGIVMLIKGINNKLEALYAFTSGQKVFFTRFWPNFFWEKSFYLILWIS